MTLSEEGEGYSRRSKRRQHLREIWTLLWKDRQADMVVHREVTLQKIGYEFLL